MRYTKIITDKRGIVTIVVKLITIDYGSFPGTGLPFKYEVITFYIPKGKRKEIYKEDIATESEIQNAKMELWQSIKPQ